jgi:hypothetical protein
MNNCKVQEDSTLSDRHFEFGQWGDISSTPTMVPENLINPRIRIATERSYNKLLR